MATESSIMKTLLYTVNGETIKVLIEKDSIDSYKVIVKGFKKIGKQTNRVAYPEPSFIFSEPCFLISPSGNTLTEYKLIEESLLGKIKILDLSYMENLVVFDDFAGNHNFEQIQLPTTTKIIKHGKILDSVKIISNSAIITHIGDNAFNRDYRDSESITFQTYSGGSIVSVGKNGFKNTKLILVSGVNTVAKFNKLTVIEESSFEGTFGLTALEAKALASVPDRAFASSSFIDLTLSSAVNFGKEPFENMALQSITIGDMNSENGGYDGSSKLDLENLDDFIIYVPTEAASNYLKEQIAAGNPMFVDKYGRSMTEENVVIGAWYNTLGHTTSEVVEAIKSNSYTGLIDVQYLNGDGYKTVTEAFESSTSIREVNLSVDALKDTVIKKIYSMKGAKLGKMTQGIVLNSSTASLKYLDLENLSLTATSKTFNVQNLSALTELTLPTSLNTINGENGDSNYGFINLKSLPELEIPNAVTSLGAGCLSGNSNLTSLTYGTNITYLPDRIFKNCPKLNFTISNTIRALGSEFLAGNTVITALTIPSSVTKISPNAFNSIVHLKKIEFEAFDKITFTGSIVSNCSELKTVFINTEGLVNVNTEIFGQKCKVYVKDDKSYETLIENTYVDKKPVYIRGDWFDSESGDVYASQPKVCDVNSSVFNEDNPVKNFTGDELFLETPDISEFNGIDKLTTLKKLTILGNIDLQFSKLPVSLVHLEILGASNVNISGLTNLTYLGLQCNQDFQKSLNGLNALKILNIGPQCTFLPSTVSKPNELVVFADDFSAIPILPNNLKTHWRSTLRRNFEEISRNYLLDIERRANRHMNLHGICVEGIREINPVATDVDDLYVFNSVFKGFDINRPGLENVYMYNVEYEDENVFNFSKQAGESFNLSSSIQYLNLGSLTYTADEEDFELTDVVERSCVILPAQDSLHQLLRTTKAQIEINAENLDILDIYTDSAQEFKTVKNVNWGIYGNISLEAVSLQNLNYAYPTTIPSGMLASTTTLASFVDLSAPSLESFIYTTRDDVSKPEMIVTFNNLKSLEVGETSDFNLLDTARTQGALTSLSELETVRFGSSTKTFGDETLKNATSLVSVYLDSVDEISVVQASTGVNPEVVVYVSSEAVYNQLLENPDLFIVGLHNIILNIEMFNTVEHPDTDELQEVYSTGKVGETLYSGIDDEAKNLYKITTGTMSLSIKTLYVYSDDENFETLMNSMNLSGVSALKIIGDNITIVNIGEGTGSETTRAKNLTSVDLSSATFVDNTLTDNAFKNCEHLKTVVLNDTIEVIGEGAFEGCPIEKFSSEEGGDSVFDTSLFSVEVAAANLVNPELSTYKVYNDSAGYIAANGFNLGLMSSQWTELRLPLSNSTTLNKLPSTVKILKISGLSTLRGTVFKNITELVVTGDTPLTIYNETFKDAAIMRVSGNISGIGQHAFDGSKISEINLPCTAVGNGAFNNCERLTKVSLPNLTTIGDEGFFEYCMNLTTVVLGPVEVKSFMFNNCPEITSITTAASKICENVLRNSKLSSLTAPNVKIVEKQAFFNTLLTEFSSETIETIGDSAFENCSELSVVNCPACKTVGASAFKNTAVSSVVLNHDELTIGASAFEYCEELGEIDLTSVMVVEKQTFRNCTKLDTVDGFSAQTIGDEAFKNCSLLKRLNSEVSGEFVVPSTSIGNEAFMNTGVNNFKGTSVSSIGQNVFKSCSIISIDLSGLSEFKTPTDCFNGLGSMTLKLGDVELTPEIFTDCKISSLSTATTSSEHLREIADSTEFTELTASGITTLSTGQFANNTRLTKIVCENLLTIGSSTDFTGVFENCSALATALFQSATIVGKNCFKNCSSLTSVDLNSCTEVHEDSFKNCGLLTSVVLSASATHVGPGAFENSGIVSFDMCSETEVHDNTFKNCGSMTSVNLRNVSKVGESSFENSKLTGLTFNVEVSLGKQSFAGCPITTIIGVEFVKSLGEGTFRKTLITEFTNSLITSVPSYAFAYCDKLEILTLEACVSNACSYSNCPALTSLTFLDLDLKSNTSCFDGCSGNITVLRNFVVPAALSTYSTFTKDVNYYTDAENVSMAKQIMTQAVFKAMERP